MARIALKSTEYTEITTTKSFFTVQNVGTDIIEVVITGTHTTPTSGGHLLSTQDFLTVQKSDYAYMYARSKSYGGEIEVAG